MESVDELTPEECFKIVQKANEYMADMILKTIIKEEKQEQEAT